MHSMWKTPFDTIICILCAAFFRFVFFSFCIPIHLSHKLRFLLCALLPLLIHAKRHQNANAQWKKSIKYSNQYFMFELPWVTCDWFWWDSISRFHVILPCAQRKYIARKFRSNWTGYELRMANGEEQEREKQQQQQQQYCLFKFCILCTASWHPGKRSAFSSKTHQDKRCAYNITQNQSEWSFWSCKMWK